MATQTKMTYDKMRQEKKIADADRAQRDLASRRQLAGQVIGAVTNVATSGISGGLQTMSKSKELATKVAQGNKVKHTYTTGKDGKWTHSREWLNSPEWYKTYTNNMEVFTNIPAFTILGNPLPKVYPNIPGIVTVTWNTATGPQIGFEHTDTALSKLPGLPVNQILMRTKEQVLKLNSRSNVPWEAADLGLNFFATREIYARILELKRVIGIALQFRSDNLFVGDALIAAAGYDPSDFRDNLAKYKQYFEIVRNRFNKALVAPKALTLYARTEYLAGSIFMDSDNSMGQIYMYKHEPAWGILSDDGGSIRFTRTSEAVTYSELTASQTSSLSLMIQRIAENPDYIAMYQDLRSAFGDSELIQIEAIPMDYETPFIKDDESLRQFRNTRTLPVLLKNGGADSYPFGTYTPDTIDSSTADIHSCSNGFLFQGMVDNSGATSIIKYNRSYLCQQATVDNTNIRGRLENLRAAVSDEVVYHTTPDSISADDMLVQTRNMTIYGPVLSTNQDEYGSKCVSVPICGTEVFLYAQEYWKDTIQNVTSFTFGSFVFQYSAVETVPQYATPKLFKLTNADWLFDVSYVYNAGQSMTSGLSLWTLGDAGKYAIVNVDNVASLHTISTLSELYINSSAFVRR